MYISEEKKKFFIIVLSSVFLLAMDIFFILNPLVNKAFDLRSQIVSINKNIGEMNQQLSTAGSLKKKLEDLKSQRAAGEKRFSREEEIPFLLQNLSAIAASSGIDIIAVKPIRADMKEQLKKTAGIFTQMPIEILAKGGYHQVGAFINSLERLDRFMEIKDIEFSQDSATPTRHHLKLLLATYILTS